MSTTKTPVSVKIIHALTVVIFWIALLITVLSFILTILTEVKVIGNDFQLKVELPVTFDLTETGHLELYGKQNNLRIEEASGKLYIIDTPIEFSQVVLRIVFVVTLLMLYMTWKFKSFITNIKNGLIFENENINNLKHIAYGILILWVITKVYMAALYYSVVQYVQFESIDMHYNVTIGYSGMLLIAILLWVLAHVFMKGVEIKEEQELVI